MSRRRLKVGSLFAGIGGLELGLERAGMEVLWQVESDPYCTKVLAKRWPQVKRYGDIKTIDFTALPNVDLISGGFPCQPVSCAGKRRGADDTRWLWPEFYRAVCEARPTWVLVENVPGLLSAENGRLFGGILADLARRGYDAEWDLLPAAAFGAPHLRYRLFLVAYSGLFGPPEHEKQTTGVEQFCQVVADPRCEYGDRGPDLCPGEGFGDRQRFEDGKEEVCLPECSGKDVANFECLRKPQSERDQQKQWKRVINSREINGDPDNGRLSNRVFGSKGKGLLKRSDWWATEPDVGRVAHGISARVDRLKCLGNAVVPQVAEWVGRQIIRANEA